jgi:CheY-like chemotaxis protein
MLVSSAMGGGARSRERTVVLLVDDAMDSRGMYAEYLSFEGYEVLEAENGVQAIATARREVPDAVVMDLVIPGMDGIEATKMLRADPVTKDVVVVALSGHGKEMEQRATEAGADRYIRKPCLPADLAVHLRELLVRRSAPGG